MNTVYQGYFDKAELALAAYADFSLAPHDGSGVQRCGGPAFSDSRLS